MKTVRIQHEYQHERWGQQAWHKLHQQEWHEHLHAQVAPVSTALRARSFVHLLMSVSHALHGSRCSWVSLHPIITHERLPLTSPSSLSTSTCPSPSSSTSPSWCTPSSTLSSTTGSPCNTTCATRRRRVTTPTTSTPPSQVMSPTTWSSTSSANSQGSFSYITHVIGPWHRRQYARQAAHRSTPRTCRLPQSGRCVSQSVVIVCRVR